MADRQVRNSAKGRVASGTRSSKNNNVETSKSRDLRSREEEYMRLNAELEAKTATLVREAEDIMLEQEHVFQKPSLLDNINSEEFFDDSPDEFGSEKPSARYKQQTLSSRSTSDQKPPSSRMGSTSRPTSKVSNHARPQSQPSKASHKPKTKSKSNLVANDVAIPDEAFMTDMNNYSLQKTISNIEQRVDHDDYQDDDDDDIVPSAAAEMGAEAQIRFLKAKLRVMQEELDRLSQELNKREEENNSFSSKIKESDEERSRLTRTNAHQQTQIDKYKRLAEDAKGKADSLENQLSGVKKELDSMKRAQKQQVSSQGATEVRLNRALEEVDRYKAQLLKSKSESKDTTDTGKRRVDQLLAENKRLEKQKNELMTGFKKQLKLIDILKRQKMHIEAAKMLAFTEEEFVKALEWGN